LAVAVVRLHRGGHGPNEPRIDREAFLVGGLLGSELEGIRKSEIDPRRPALVALGVPAVNANITNTVALCPGYFGAAYSQRAALASQHRRLPWMAAVAASTARLISSARRPSALASNAESTWSAASWECPPTASDTP